MSNKDVPEPWASRMTDRGFTDGRGSGRPSMSALARKIGVHTSTVSAAIHGERGTSAEVVAELAKHLGADVAEWLGREYHGPWDPPASSALLTDRQRKAIGELINSMTERQEQGHGQDKAPIDDAGGTPVISLTPGSSSAGREEGTEPERQDLPLASHPKKGRESTGRRLRAELDEVGEDNQEPEEGE